MPLFLTHSKNTSDSTAYSIDSNGKTIARIARQSYE